MGIFKWIGGVLGFMLAPPLGAFAGYFIGSLIDSLSENDGSGYEEGPAGTYGNSTRRSHEEGQRNSFLFSLLVLASYIIRADNKVMHSEMEYVRNFLRSNFGEAAAQQGNEIILRLLEEQKRINASNPYAYRNQIRQVCAQIAANLNYSERLQLLSFLVEIAKADGHVSQEELNALYEVAQYMGMSASEVDSMLHMGGGSYGGGRSGGGRSGGGRSGGGSLQGAWHLPQRHRRGSEESLPQARPRASSRPSVGTGRGCAQGSREEVQGDQCRKREDLQGPRAINLSPPHPSSPPPGARG